MKKRIIKCTVKVENVHCNGEKIRQIFLNSNLISSFIHSFIYSFIYLSYLFHFLFIYLFSIYLFIFFPLGGVLSG